MLFSQVIKILIYRVLHISYNVIPSVANFIFIKVLKTINAWDYSHVTKFLLSKLPNVPQLFKQESKVKNWYPVNWVWYSCNFTVLALFYMLWTNRHLTCFVLRLHSEIFFKIFMLFVTTVKSLSSYVIFLTENQLYIIHWIYTSSQ